MLAIIRGASSQVALDIPASPEWTMSDLRRHGEMKVTIPRNSTAWSADVISDDGGFFFEVPTPFGLWRGIADVPVYSDAGADITVRNITHWLSIRTVGFQQYYGLTAGAIAKEAVRQGLLTILPVTIGTILEAPPIIPNYEFRGQSVLDVFTDLSELTSQTWELDELYRVNWLHRQGDQHELWIIDDGKILPRIQTDTLGDAFSETVEIDDTGRRFSAFEYTSPLWPQQREVQLGNES